MDQSPSSSFGLTDASSILGFGAALAQVDSRAEVARLLSGAMPAVVPAALQAVVLHGTAQAAAVVQGQLHGKPLASDAADELRQLLAEDNVEALSAQQDVPIRAADAPVLAATDVRRLLITRIGTVDRTFGVAVVGQSDAALQDAPDAAALQLLGGQACIALDRIRVETERAAKARALKERKERYRTLSEAVFEGVVFTDQGTIIDLNRQFAEMMGYPREELLDTDVLRLVAPAERKQAEKHIASGYEEAYESVCQRKDGTTFPVEVRGRMMAHQGRAVRVTAVRDITEQKRTEHALRHARDELEVRVAERTAALERANAELKAEVTERRQAQEAQARQLSAMEAAMVGMSIHDRNGIFRYANQAHADIYGYDDPSELIGRSWEMLYDAEHITFIENNVIPEVANGRRWSGELVGRKKSGARFDVHLSLAPLDDGGLACVCQDITDQKASEQALRQYANRLEMLRTIDQAILSAQSPQSIAQAAMRQMRQVLPIVRSSVVLFDREAGMAEVLAHHQLGETSLAAGARVPLDDMHITSAIWEGRSRIVDDLTALDHTAVTAQLHDEGVQAYMNLPMVVEGEPIGMVNIGADHVGAFGDEECKIAREVADQLAIAIRQARLLEQVKEQTERLEQRVQERTAELESFTYSVSHDLRTPLRAIDGFSRMLRDQYVQHLDPEGQRLVNVIYDSAQRMGQLIDGLLALSRIGRREMRTAPLDLAALVREVIEELQRPHPEWDVAVEIGDLPPARGDRAMVRQVLVNLFSNAFKFTQNEATPCIEVGATVEDGTPVYYVRDNGAGFDMDYADKLFGVFERLHDDTFDGTGVGLAIAERVIERHDGRIWARGAEGEGATFFFTLQ